MLVTIVNTFKCYLIYSHVYSYNGNNKQLFHVSLYFRNCIKVYLNDILVPKRSVYLVSTYKNTDTIKVKVCGLFNKQTIFLQITAASIDVNFPLFEKKSVLLAIETKKIISHKRFYLSSLVRQKCIKIDKRMARIQTVNVSKTLKLESEIRNQNYNLTNITNNYEQAILSNT